MKKGDSVYYVERKMSFLPVWNWVGGIAFTLERARDEIELDKENRKPAIVIEETN